MGTTTSNSPVEPKFSDFTAPIKNVIPQKEVTIRDIYEYIIGDKAKSATAELRNIKEHKSAQAFKATHFDFCTFSGTFTQRSASHLTSHSGLLCIDFDGLQNVEEVKEMLINDKYLNTRLIFRSPSGNGIKWIVSIDLTRATHQEYFDAVMAYVKNTYDIEADKSGRDVCRSCFLPFDPEAILQDKDISSFPFIPSEWINNSSEINNSMDMPEQIENLVSEIELQHIDLTQEYSHWCNIGFALVDALGESGRDYFHRLSRINPQYDTKCCNEQYDKCLKSKGNGITISTLFYYAQQFNVVLPSAQSVINAQSAPHAFKSMERRDESICSDASRAESADNAESAGLEGGGKPIPVPPMSYILKEIDGNSLPSLMQDMLALSRSYQDADALFIGTLVVISTCLPNISGRYDGSEYYANLYAFLYASAGSGKGRLKLCKYLVQPIEERMIKENQKQIEKYKRDLATYNKDKDADPTEMPEFPIEKHLFMPADTTKAAISKHLNDNEGCGLIFETEAAKLARANKEENGKIYDILLEAFQHEDVSCNRICCGNININKPKISILLTGTPSQIKFLIPNASDGLYSRFIIYHIEEDFTYHNPFAEMYNQAYKENVLEMAQRVMTLYDRLRNSKQPINFIYTQEQGILHTRFIAQMKEELMAQVGITMNAVVNRMGLISFRIAMVLSALRLVDQPSFPTTLVCRDDDFETALRSAEQLLLHSSHLLESIPEMKAKEPDPFPGLKQKELYMALPLEFDKAKWDEIAISSDINVRTAERYLKAWCEHKLITKIERNHYRKGNFSGTKDLERDTQRNSECPTQT